MTRRGSPARNGAAASGRRRSSPSPIPTRPRPAWRTCVWRGPSSRPTSTSIPRSCSSSSRRATRCARRLPSGSRSAPPSRNARAALAREQADRSGHLRGDRDAVVGRRRHRSHRRAEGAVGRPAADAVGIRGVADAPVPGCLSRVRGSRAAPDAGRGRGRPARDARDRARAAAGVGRSRSRKSSRGGAGCAAMPTCFASMRSANPRGRRAARARDRDARGEGAASSSEVRAKQEQDNLRRLQQIVPPGRDAGGGRADHAQGRRSRAARHPLGDRRSRAATVEEGSAGIQARLEAARAELAPRVQELRDADEWQRWANLQVQEELCKEMEALKAEENLDAAGRRMRELQARWKQVALAPRAQGEAMWRRFKTAQDEVFARTAAHFAAQNEERAANLVASRRSASAPRRWPIRPTGSRRPPRFRRCRRSGRRSVPSAAVTRRRCGSGSAPPATLLHAPAGGSEAPQGRVGVEPREKRKRSARRPKRWPIPRSGRPPPRSSSSCRPSGRRSGRSGSRSRTPSGSASAPRAIASSIATSIAIRSQLREKAAARDAVIRELEALAARGRPPSRRRARRAVRHRAAGARSEVAAGARSCRGRCSRISPPATTQAVGRLVAAWPSAFAGTDLDPEATRKRMEKLVDKVEDLLSAARQPRAGAKLSPTELLARQWRERLAANTMAGGARPKAEESRWRAAEQEVRSAQAQWMRLGPVPAEVAGPLNERFQRACRRFFEQRRRAS